MDCKLRCWNARQAQKFNIKLSAAQRMILLRSDPLTHTEFQFSKLYDEISFSATLMDGFNGCRFKTIGYSHPEFWTTLVLPMTNEQEDRAWKRAQEINHKQYDLIGLGSFGTEWEIIKPNPDKYWCSEACAELIKAAYESDGSFIPHFYHPVGLFFDMYRRLQKQGT